MISLLKRLRLRNKDTRGFRTPQGGVNMSSTDHSGQSLKNVRVAVGKGGKWVGLPRAPRK
jgi:hypothetical protein